MLFRLAAVEHQHHRPCVVILSEALTRIIVLIRARDGSDSAFRVMQRRAVGGLPAWRPEGPLDRLDMHEIAIRALRERGLDPRTATWDDIRSRAQ